MGMGCRKEMVERVEGEMGKEGRKSVTACTSRSPIRELCRSAK